ncbi:MAG: hypothetical protein V3W41_21960 [Planctomycetota bacterium]
MSVSFPPGWSKLPEPHCAVCQLPVAVLWAFDNERREQVWFLASCHGQSEILKVSYAEANIYIEQGVLSVRFKGDAPQGTANPRGFTPLAGDITHRVTGAPKPD